MEAIPKCPPPSSFGFQGVPRLGLLLPRRMEGLAWEHLRSFLGISSSEQGFIRPCQQLCGRSLAAAHPGQVSGLEDASEFLSMSPWVFAGCTPRTHG